MDRQRIALALFRVTLAVALVVTMYVATTQQELPVIDNTNDKLKHILAFYVLAFLADFSVPPVRFNLSKGLSILGYGLLIETIQYFLPHREFSLHDLAADGVGITTYVLSQSTLKRFYFPRPR